MTYSPAPITPLDAAHAAMQDNPQDDAARLRYFARLADGALFLLLEAEAQGDTLSPRVFPLEDGPVVLAFDTEERLAAFTGAVAPYAQLPGRVIAGQLAGQGIGLGINLGVADSAFLLPPDALGWLVGTLAQAPQRVDGRPVSVHAPGALPEGLLSALAEKFGPLGAILRAAAVAGVVYDDGRRGHMLALLDARSGAQDALARAAAEALAFSGIEAGEMDVVFLGRDDALARAMLGAGVRLDIPEPSAPEPGAPPAAPGMDPARPPILR